VPAQFCSSRKEIRTIVTRGNGVLNGGYKIYAKIINGKLKTAMDAVVLEGQQGFRKGRCALNNIYICCAANNREETQTYLQMHIAFMDSEKAVDETATNYETSCINASIQPTL
jgi:hypothetical protein